MVQERDLEARVLADLREQGPCTMDELCKRLHSCTWNQVFSVVDRLSRQGTLHLQHPTPFTYTVLLAPQGGRQPVRSDITGSAGDGLPLRFAGLEQEHA